MGWLIVKMVMVDDEMDDDIFINFLVFDL